MQSGGEALIPKAVKSLMFLFSLFLPVWLIRETPSTLLDLVTSALVISTPNFVLAVTPIVFRLSFVSSFSVAIRSGPAFLAVFEWLLFKLLLPRSERILSYLNSNRNRVLPSYNGNPGFSLCARAVQSCSGFCYNTFIRSCPNFLQFLSS